MFILTGSANVWGTLKISESLAGRAERITLWPLSQGEIRGKREVLIDELYAGRAPEVTAAPIGRAAIAGVLSTGGYPEALTRSEPKRRRRWFGEYLAMTLERDVLDLARNARQLEELPHLLRLAAAQSSGLLSTAGMARDAKLSAETVRRYLTLLEQLFLLTRGRAWSRNFGQRLIKSPKLWLADTGLACHLLDYDSRRFEDDETSLAGALFENFVAMELLKQSGWSEAEVRLHHFRTAGGREIDVLLERQDGAVVGIEVKLGATPRSGDFRTLEFLRDELGSRFKGGAVIHTGSETLPFGPRLWALPVSALWA